MQTRSAARSRALSGAVVLGLSLFASPLFADTDSHDVTLTMHEKSYVPGWSKWINFTMTVATDGTAEFVDQVSFDFAFPAASAIASAQGPSPFSGCGAGLGNFSAPNAHTALWATPGHPSGCGAFDTGTYRFSVLFVPPVGYEGSVGVVATTEGDGWPSPLGDYEINIFNLELRPGLFEDTFEFNGYCAWEVVVGAPTCL